VNHRARRVVPTDRGCGPDAGRAASSPGPLPPRHMTLLVIRRRDGTLRKSWRDRDPGRRVAPPRRRVSNATWNSERDPLWIHLRRMSGCRRVRSDRQRRLHLPGAGSGGACPRYRDAGRGRRHRRHRLRHERHGFSDGRRCHRRRDRRQWHSSGIAGTETPTFSAGASLRARPDASATSAGRSPAPPRRALGCRRLPPEPER